MNPQEKHTPPKWADQFLVWYHAPELIEETQGDLHEAFHRHCQKLGVRQARFLFVADVLRSISLRTIDRSFLSPGNPRPMLRNYTTLTCRMLLRNKVFSFINIFGLAVGMAAVFLIMQYVYFESSYDRFHKDSDRIFRVYMERQAPNRHINTATIHPGPAPAMKAEFPEVEEYVRMLPQGIRMPRIVTMSYVDGKGKEKVFYEENIYTVDPSFFKVFSFPLLSGNPADVLREAHSIVLSESIATKYFGSEDPIGKTLMGNGERPFQVTGVFKDIPGNSHIHFDMLVSFLFVQQSGSGFDQAGHWKWPEFYTYVKLAPDADVKAFKEKVADLIIRHNGAHLKERNSREHLRLQALADIHLRSPDMIQEREVRGSEQIVYFLLLIAGLILLIAWINYINLSTSKSVERAKEVGLRKVVGALKRQLMLQFLLESFALNLMALLFALLFTWLAYPYFTDLTGKNMGSSLFDAGLVGQPLFWWAVVGIFLTGSFLAGLYPAFVLSAFRIVTVLKGKFSASKSGIALRKVLVASQFIISVGLIGGTIMIFKQVEFMKNYELGFAKEQLLIVKPPKVMDSLAQVRQESFQAELKRNTAVRNITASSDIPGALITNRQSIRNPEDENLQRVFQYYIDHAFADTYGLKILVGRNFREDERLLAFKPEAEGLPSPIMLNIRAVESLGYKNPEDAVNHRIYFGLGDREWLAEIVGVVDNFSQQSLKTEYEPMIFLPLPYAEYFTLNIDVTRLTETVAYVKDQYEASFPGNPFDYFFMDDYFNKQYASDQQFQKVFALFSMLALMIAGLGLYGLTIFMITQRTKEIAVRKILGASVPNMIGLFSKGFVRLIVIANLIALPATYFLVHRWLNTFAFRIDIGWLMFAAPPLTLLMISIFTVAVHTAKKALSNPVNALRVE